MNLTPQQNSAFTRSYSKTVRIAQTTQVDATYNNPTGQSSLKVVPTVNKAAKSKRDTKRWLCNVSEGVKLGKNVKNGLNVATTSVYSQYDLMVKLLKAENCDVIYFDCHLSASQIGILKMLQVFSNTELVHARIAMQFDREIS